jgi:tRNA-2-methylthio-N6-dimethylallyladenosine synthase
LIEGTSKRSESDWFGRTTHNTVVVFPRSDEKPGDFVNVRIKDCTTATLLGERVFD